MLPTLTSNRDDFGSKNRSIWGPAPKGSKISFSEAIGACPETTLNPPDPQKRLFSNDKSASREKKQKIRKTTDVANTAPKKTNVQRSVGQIHALIVVKCTIFKNCEKNR